MRGHGGAAEKLAETNLCILSGAAAAVICLVAVGLPGWKSDAGHQAFRALGSPKTRDALLRQQHRLQLSIFAVYLLTTRSLIAANLITSQVLRVGLPVFLTPI